MNVDSGSWIYILLSIVFLVLSAIGNKNKKKASTSTQPIDEDYEPGNAPAEKHWPKSFEDVLNEVLDIPKQKEVIIEKPYSPPIEVREVREKNIYERYENEAQSLETIEAEVFSYETPVEDKTPAKPIYQKMEVPKEIEKEEELAVTLSDSDFDLRQGIIYTEILNRKYF